MPGVQLAMQRFDSMEQENVARPRTLPADVLGRRRMLFHREVQKLPLGGSSEATRNPGIEESDNGLEHLIRGGRVAPMDPEHRPAETKHDSSIGVSKHPIDIPQSEISKP
jgi:hypothetical protein